MVKLRDTIERTMFYGASPLIFERAKMMRINPTEAEKKLLEILNKNQMLGLRFKFQHPVDKFIADFYCHKIRLVVEVDGEIHLTKDIRERDEGRSKELERLGIQVIRFSNDQVINEIQFVKTTIENKCKEILEMDNFAKVGGEI